MSKIVSENSRVRVRDVTFPRWHHPHAREPVFTETGEPAETVKFDVGSVGYRKANVTHPAANPGKTPMRVIEVELK